MTLRSRARLLLTVVVVAMLALGTLVGLRFLELQQSRLVLTNQVYPASELAAEYFYSLMQMNRGLAAYAETGDPAALEEFTEGRAGSERAAAGMSPLLTGELAPLREQWAAIDQQRQQWLSGEVDPLLTAASDGVQPAADTQITAISGIAVLSIIKALNQRMLAGIAETNTLASRLAVALGVLAGGLIALTIAATWATRSWVLTPLADLGEQMTRLTSSHATDSSLTPSGPPEVADVGVRAEYLRQQLVGQLESVRAAQEGLTQESPVVAALQPLVAPARVPELPGVAIGVARLPARGVMAGDWWDAVTLAADDGAVAVGDISGHGPAAGVAAMRLRTALRSSVGTGADIRTAVGHATGLFVEQPASFSSLVVVALSTGDVRWLNAGHNEPFLLRHDGDVRRLRVTGPVLSALGGHWDLAHTTWGPGDVVVLFTDGLVEARKLAGDEVGEQVVGCWSAELRHEARHEPAAQRVQFMAGGLLDRVRMAAVDIRRDDVTVIVLEHL